MTEILRTWLDHFSPQAQAAIIAAIVGLATGLVGPAAKHWLDRWSLRHRLQTEHEYSERKKLRELISRFHGRVLEAAESLNHRLWNLQKNQSEGWLNLDGDYAAVGNAYYFRTTIHRLLSLLISLKQFQEEAIYIDARIAEKKDLLFLQYAKALEWVITDVALFEGLYYDANHSTDHMFKGHIRVACEVCTAPGVPLSLGEFERRLRNGDFTHELKPLYLFFDGLAADGSLRWSRIVSFHLLLCAFINAFGYQMQKTTRKQFHQLAATIPHPEVIQNLGGWLKKLGIHRDPGGKTVSRVTRKEGKRKDKTKTA